MRSKPPKPKTSEPIRDGAMHPPSQLPSGTKEYVRPSTSRLRFYYRVYLASKERFRQVRNISCNVTVFGISRETYVPSRKSAAIADHKTQEHSVVARKSALWVATWFRQTGGGPN